MKNYLEKLITEKGMNAQDDINIDGHIGFTYEMLFDFIESMPSRHERIKNTLINIDFKNGDVFHYLDYLANGMIKTLGY